MAGYGYDEWSKSACHEASFALHNEIVVIERIQGLSPAISEQTGRDWHSDALVDRSRVVKSLDQAARSYTVPRPTIGEISLAEQARMRAELRRARYGDLLALPLLLLCATGVDNLFGA